VRLPEEIGVIPCVVASAGYVKTAIADRAFAVVRHNNEMVVQGIYTVI
jgi:hypothetical protein